MHSAHDTTLFASSSSQNALPPWQPVALETEVMVAGFRDCSYEALTYLIQEENLELDDPVVVGLQQFLVAREEQLRLEESLNNASKYSQSGCYYYPGAGYGYHGNQYYSHMVMPHNDTNISYHDTVQSPLTLVNHLNDSLESITDSIMSDTESTACDSEVEDILLGYHDNDSHQQPDMVELKDTAGTLNGLAENNDKIGNLLSELFGLMDEEERESGVFQPLSSLSCRDCTSV